jgi:hypothetical protein
MKVFRLDLRTDPDILSGLVSILRNRQELEPTDKLKNVLYNVASKWIELNLGLFMYMYVCMFIYIYMYI